MGGWGKTTIGETYGEGYMLTTLQAAMLKTVQGGDVVTGADCKPA